MWNDVKDLLQTRLETLEDGLQAHRFRENVQALVNCVKELGTNVSNIAWSIDVSSSRDLEGAVQSIDDYEVYIYAAFPFISTWALINFFEI